MSSKGLGHAEVYDGNGKIVVSDTLTCAHCQEIYDKPKRGEESGFCMRCFAPVCLGCGKVDTCVPFEKKLLAMEQRDRFLKAVLG